MLAILEAYGTWPFGWNACGLQLGFVALVGVRIIWYNVVHGAEDHCQLSQRPDGTTAVVLLLLLLKAPGIGRAESLVEACRQGQGQIAD